MGFYCKRVNPKEDVNPMVGDLLCNALWKNFSFMPLSFSSKYLLAREDPLYVKGQKSLGDLAILLLQPDKKMQASTT